MSELVCSNCGKKFWRPGKKRYKNCFCDKKCEAEFRKGKLTHQKKTNEIIIKDNYAIVKIRNNRFGELDCLIDIDDIVLVKNYFWNIRYDHRHPKCTVYVEAHENNKRVHIHRLLTNCPPDMVVDHINGDGLDNRRNNLRVVTQQQNAKNRTNKLVTGVYYNKRDNFWLVQIGKKIYGRYSSKEEAVRKRISLNNLIKNGEWEKLEKMKCDFLTDVRNGLQRNNTTGVAGISRNKGKYQVCYKGKYLATVTSIEQGIKIQQQYIEHLAQETTHQE